MRVVNVPGVHTCPRPIYDPGLPRALSTSSGADGSGLEELLIHYFHHLRGTPWAAQVITRRAPRGPNYLRLSERLCVLLEEQGAADPLGAAYADRKSTRLNSSHVAISYAVFCLKKQ